MNAALRVLSVLFALLWVTGADAATCTWSGGAGNWDNTNTASWSCGHVPVAADTVVLDGTSGGGTVTVCGASSANCPNGAGVVTVTSITAGAFTGTLDFATNNPNVTAATVSFSGAGTRTINCGSGTYLLTGTTGNVFDVTTGTGLTFSCASIVITANATLTGTRTLALGTSRSYGTINLVAGGSTGFSTDISGTGTTIANLNFTAPLFVRFANTTTYTITNAFSWAGTAFNSGFIITPANTTPTISVASGSPTIAWAAITGIAFTGGATFTATNSIDGKGNSGITITGPSSGGGGRCIGC